MKLRVTIIALAAVAMPVSAWAMPQSDAPTGSLIPAPQAATVPDGNNDSAAVLRVVREFGECAAKDHSLSQKLLTVLPESKEERSAVEWMAQSDCLNYGGTIRFPPDLLRGVVAEYLLSQMNAAGPKDWTRLAVFAVPGADALAQDDPVQRADIALIEFGQCVATKDMDSVKALMQTRPNSAEEGAAFSKLGPVLGGCAEKGVSLKLNRFQLRGYLAEGAYRAMVVQSKDSGRAHS